jgi:phosphoserine phosphatase
LSTRVIILRHGQSSYNSQGKIQGRSDLSVLTEKGQADAKTTGAALHSLQLAAVYCSPLQRARQTAAAVVASQSQPDLVQADDRLLEIDLPLWETLFNTEVREKYATEYRIWKERPHELKMPRPQPDGTSQEFFPVLDLYTQATTFWQGILPQHQGQTILIVAHNGINRALIGTALGIPPRMYHSIQQSNCGVTVLNFSGNWGESVQIESLNQTSHLGQNLPTFRPPNQGPRLLLIRHGETDWAN